MARTRYPGIYTRDSRHGKVYDATASHGGKQRQRRGFPSLEQARIWQSETLEDMRAGRAGKAPARLTFKAYWTERWLPSKEPDLHPHSMKTYKSLGHRILATLGEKRLVSIAEVDVQDFMTSLHQDGMASSSRRVVFAILSAALEDARRWKLIKFNPCVDVTAPSPDRKRQPQLSREAIGKLMEAAVAEGYGMLVHLTLATGMRFGELAALTWGNLDFADRSLFIPDAKTADGVRGVALDTDTLEALKAHRLQQIKDWGEGISHVFLGPRGNPLGGSFRSPWSRMVKAAGVPSLHFHDLRHVHGTLLARAGVHPAIAQRRLGHSRSSFTLDIYTHVVDEDQREAAEAIGLALALQEPLN